MENNIDNEMLTEEVKQEPTEVASNKPYKFSNKEQRADAVEYDDYNKIEDATSTLPNATKEALVKFIEIVRGLTDPNSPDKRTVPAETALDTVFHAINAGQVNSDEMPINPGSIYQNNITNNEDFSMTPYKLVSKPKSGRVTGDYVAYKTLSDRGIGEPVHVPLWHSGFWIILNPPLNRELINLRMEIASQHYELAASTSGLIYTNYGVVFKRILTDFIMSHIKGTSLDLHETDNILDYIRIEDYYPLVAGMLQTMYPNGHRFAESCVNGSVLDMDTLKPKCNSKLVANIDFSSMLYLDRSKITNDMVYQMSKRRPSSVKPNEVREYQNRLIANLTKRTMDIGGGTKLHFKSPSLAKHLDAGEAWVNNIISLAETMFTKSYSLQAKNNHIERITNTVTLSLLNTFVNKVEVDNGDAYIDTQNEIDKFLDSLSNDDDILETVVNAYKDFVRASTLSVIGITRYTCPACKGSREPAENLSKEFVDIVPLNVDEVFLGLCDQRIGWMEDDEMFGTTGTSV